MSQHEELFNEIDEFLKNAPEKPKLLSEEDVEKLITAFAIKRDGKGFTEDECVNVVRWGEQAVLAYTMLGMVLDGTVSIDWDKDDVLIGMTAYGKERLRQTLSG